MEQATKKVSGINDATLNFMTQKLIVDFEDGQNIDAVMQEVYKLCKKIESDFVINL